MILICQLLLSQKKSLEGFDNEIMSFRAQLRRYIDFIIFCNLLTLIYKRIIFCRGNQVRIK